jgi:succinyl-diaminopimelate desuccinylase
MADDDTLALAQALIARASITPDDAGCQTLIAEHLRAAGFAIEHLRFGEVDNLWAIAGIDGPLLCFAGHTDVVPPGPLADWHCDPFAACIEAGQLYGRGAADMKSGLAAMVCAAERFRHAQPDHRGRLAFLLTSDEEGPAENGTRAVMAWLAERDIDIDYCVLGEPSSERTLADTIKNGRRGSLNAHIRVRGRQGHVAYPRRADNALHRLLPLLTELAAERWDDGDALFPPTSFQISNITAGTGAENVIPGLAEARCNWRFSPAQNAGALKRHVAKRCAAHAIDPEAIAWRTSGAPFITRSGALIDAAQAAIRAETGSPARLSTAGGTSDGRFIAPSGTEVIELGPGNTTVHQANEHIPAADVARLAGLYEALMKRLLV